jgi:protein-L-isoaspartate(D-aspartate) O-methyltransferase
MNDTITASPDVLRAQMVDRITAAGWAQSRAVAEALRAVPRHLFVPDAPVPDAYADQAVITKRDATGTALSCASEPLIVAMMLDQLDVHPGDKILEVGAGTGYNAALLAHLTGPNGQVTTVDIDPDVTARARHALDTTGNTRVNVATRGGTLGDADHARYDRIIVTVGAWDIPAAWWEQLAPGGRLVMPLRWRGQTRSVAFDHTDHLLRSDSVHLCGFVPMVGQEGERSGHIDPSGRVALYWDEDQSIDPVSLRGVLDQPKTTLWSTVTVGAEDPFDGVWLRLTSAEPGTCRIAASPDAVKAGLCTPAISVRSPALVEDTSLAYLSLRRLDQGGSPESSWELGTVGHGPAGRQLADRLCGQIRAWDHSSTAQPLIIAHPAGTLDDEPWQGHLIRKRATRLTVSY